jgi:hypothetical protein
MSRRGRIASDPLSVESGLNKHQGPTFTGLNRRRPVCRLLRPGSRRTGNSVDEVL